MQSNWASMFVGAGSKRPHRCQMEFEGKSVERVLHAFGLSSYKNELIRHYKTSWGKGWRQPLLTFESFYDYFPTFPVMLTAQSFYGATAKVPMMTLSGWMTGFEKTFIWNRYCELVGHYRAICERRTVIDAIPPSLHGLPVGMIFDYDGLPGGLILHNGEPLTKGLCPRFDGKISTRLAGPPEPIRCWIEPFGDWLAALAQRGWSPGQTPNPVGVESAPPLPYRERAIPLLPWAVRALKGGPDSILLSWLHHVLKADPETHPRAAAFRKNWKGELCVAATHAALGYVLRLTRKQVKTAIESLRDEGFVRTKRGRTRHGVSTVFFLDNDRCADARRADWEASEIREECPPELEPFRSWDDGINSAVFRELLKYQISVPRNNSEEPN